MRKYIISKDLNSDNHWNNCMELEIPYIQIFHARTYSKVEYDILPMLRFHDINEGLLDFFLSFYKNYSEFFLLPKEKYSCIGGNKALIFTVYKEHAEFIANQLFDFLLSYVNKNKMQVISS